MMPVEFLASSTNEIGAWCRWKLPCCEICVSGVPGVDLVWAWEKTKQATLVCKKNMYDTWSSKSFLWFNQKKQRFFFSSWRQKIKDQHFFRTKIGFQVSKRQKIQSGFPIPPKRSLHVILVTRTGTAQVLADCFGVEAKGMWSLVSLKRRVLEETWKLVVLQ